MRLARRLVGQLVGGKADVTKLIYVKRTLMNRFTRVNGSVAATVVFLFWVYTQAVILLYGVEFTAAYARLRRGRPEEIPAAPAPRT